MEYSLEANMLGIGNIVDDVSLGVVGFVHFSDNFFFGKNSWTCNMLILPTTS